MLRNGLLTLVMGLVLCVGIGQATVSAVPGAVPSEAEDIKENELLEALVRSGKLPAAEAALESSLSVEEAERMLQALAAKDHLEVSLEHGWPHHALRGSALLPHKACESSTG